MCDQEIVVHYRSTRYLPETLDFHRRCSLDKKVGKLIIDNGRRIIDLFDYISLFDLVTLLESMIF